MPSPLAEAKNASAFVPGDAARRLVLRNVDLKIDPGGHAAVMGANGAGKSVLLKLLHGDLRACAGSISWRDGAGMSSSPIAARFLCGLISPHIQGNCQAQGWDVAVAAVITRPEVPIACAHDPSDAEKMRALALLKDLGAADLVDRKLPELSKGQLRLVLLARQLARCPRLLLLDEWESGLDAAHARLAHDLLEAHAPAITMLFTGHRLSSIPVWAKTRYLIEAGRLSPAGRSFSRNMPESRKMATQTRSASRPASFADEPPVFDLRNVSVYINRQPVLRNIDWVLARGQHWRIAGGNGSGKSTFLRLLAGDEFVAAGGKLVHYSHGLGRNVSSLREKRKLVALVSDLSEALYDYPLNVLETVLSGFDGAIGLWRSFSCAEVERARHLLAFFLPDLQPWDMSIRTLSTGQLRKAFFARSLAPRPETLLLDEPFAGLDPTSRRDMSGLLGRLAAGALENWTPGIVMVSHHDEDIPAFVTHLAQMENGILKISAQCPDRNL